MFVRLGAALCVGVVLLGGCSGDPIGPTQPTPSAGRPGLVPKASRNSADSSRSSPSVTRLEKKGTAAQSRSSGRDVVREEYEEAGYLWVAEAWIWDITQPYQNPTMQYGARSTSYDSDGFPLPIDVIWVADDVDYRRLGEERWKPLADDEQYRYNDWKAELEWISSFPYAWQARSLSGHYWQDFVYTYLVYLEHPVVTAKWVIDKVSD